MAAETRTTNFEIVPANPRIHGLDISEMIKELAVFEKMEEQFQKLPIENDLERGYCRAFVAICQEKVVGYALFYYAYSTWVGRFIHLEDLYVKPEYRRIGIGKALLKAVTKVCLEENITRLQLNVLDWNKNAINFYKKHGGIDLMETEGWLVYRLPQQSIEKLAKEQNKE